MRAYGTATATALAASAIRARGLVWISARDAVSGSPVTLGLWTGIEERSFTIGGSPRTYVGAGTLLEIPPVIMGTGIEVRVLRLSLNLGAAEVGQLVADHDARFAPVEVHRALFDVETDALVEEPHRMFKGRVDELTVQRTEGRIELSLVSTARDLTRALARRKSDAAQQLAHPGDRIRRFVGVTGRVMVKWGEA